MEKKIVFPEHGWERNSWTCQCQYFPWRLAAFWNVSTGRRFIIFISHPSLCAEGPCEIKKKNIKKQTERGSGERLEQCEHLCCLDAECGSVSRKPDSLEATSTEPLCPPGEIHLYCSFSGWGHSCMKSPAQRHFSLSHLLIISMTTRDFNQAATIPHTSSSF